jgi:hypothetical protein
MISGKFRFSAQREVQMPKWLMYYFENGSPHISAAEYYLGVAYFLLGDYARARGYLAPIYPQRLDNPQINLCLGYSYLHSKPQELGLAKKYLHRAEALGQRLPAGWLQELVRTFGAWPAG